MRGPESMDGYEKTHEATPRVDRDSVLDAIVTLHATNPNVDFMDLKDKEVDRVKSMYTEWTKSLGEMESAEGRLIGYLEQNMLMFDAGLITNEEGLRSLDKDLDDQLAQVKGDSFTDYEKLIGDYKAQIGSLLNRADR